MPNQPVHNQPVHICADDLILYMDGELAESELLSIEQHLGECTACRAQFQYLQNGSSAYDGYVQQVLKRPWQATLPAAKSKRHWLPAAIALAAALCFGLWFLFKPAVPPVQQLLAAASAAPTSNSRPPILFTSGRYHFARPAVLEAGTPEARFPHVQALFIKANYNWTDPLSARSFAAWRRQLPERQDSVRTLHAGNGQLLYQVKTNTHSSDLQTASLTLEMTSLHAAAAAFQFVGEEVIQVSETNETTANPLPARPQAVPAGAPNAPPEAASPEDELRVFAALDSMGAGPEEPIDIKLDSNRHNVLVTGLGMPAARRKQLETALASLPNTVVRFRLTQPFENDSSAEAPSNPAGHSPEFRPKLEQLAGGVRPLQTLTDEALESSNTLFAQAHSLLVLAHEFPPNIEQHLSPAGANTLLALRQRRVGAMLSTLRRLNDQLAPILTDSTELPAEAAASSWQAAAADLYEESRNLDRLLSRLLAGSYEEQNGDAMLKRVPADIAKIRSLILAGSR